MSNKKKSSFFYGWVVLGLSFLSMVMNNTIHFSFPLFFVSILNEFGWNRADTSLIFSLNYFVMGVAAPFVGLFIDRFGPRLALTAGAIMLAASTILMSQATEIWHFCALFGVLASLGICLTGVVPNSTIATRWFVSHRGAVMGIISLGIGLGSAFVSLIAVIIERVGWRNTFALLTFFPLLSAPFFAIFMRLDPSEKGLKPFGLNKAEPDNHRRAEGRIVVLDEKWAGTVWTPSKAVRTFRFWAIILTGFFAGGVGLGLVRSHQIAFAIDSGYTTEFASLIFSLYGITSSAGNLLGFISDRYGREVTATAGYMLMIAGMGMLILNERSRTPYFLYAFAVLTGTGAGIVSPAFAAAMADLFQGKNFGAIYGLSILGFGLGGTIGPWMGGLIFDSAGTYVPAFMLVIAAFALSIACFWVAAPRHIRLIAPKKR
jgi:MFS family permease